MRRQSERSWFNIIVRLWRCENIVFHFKQSEYTNIKKFIAIQGIQSFCCSQVLRNCRCIVRISNVFDVFKWTLIRRYGATETSNRTANHTFDGIYSKTAGFIASRFKTRIQVSYHPNLQLNAELFITYLIKELIKSLWSCWIRCSRKILVAFRIISLSWMSLQRSCMSLYEWFTEITRKIISADWSCRWHHPDCKTWWLKSCAWQVLPRWTSHHSNYVANGSLEKVNIGLLFFFLHFDIWTFSVAILWVSFARVIYQRRVDNDQRWKTSQRGSHFRWCEVAIPIWNSVAKAAL